MAFRVQRSHELSEMPELLGCQGRRARLLEPLKHLEAQIDRPTQRSWLVPAWRMWSPSCVRV